MAVTTEKEAEAQSGDNRTMGRKHIVPYGLYRAHGFISAHLAKKTTGFSEDDLSKLWQALEQMFEHDRSAARGEMVGRHLVVFKHASALGNAPSHELFERVVVDRVQGEKGSPAQAFSDYSVKLDGGMIEHSLHEILVIALPGAMPTEIVVDITELRIGQAIRVADVKAGKPYEILNADNAVVVSIAMSRNAVADTDDDAGEEEAAPAEESAE